MADAFVPTRTRKEGRGKGVLRDGMNLWGLGLREAGRDCHLSALTCVRACVWAYTWIPGARV